MKEASDRLSAQLGRTPGSPHPPLSPSPQRSSPVLLSSLITAVPVSLNHPHLTFMLTGGAWQHRGGRPALTLSPALCQPVWAVSCPGATAAQREPRDKGPLCGGSSQRAGAGWSVCVNILLSLGKPPPPPPPPQVLKALCARGTMGTSRMPAQARQLARGWQRGARAGCGAGGRQAFGEERAAHRKTTWGWHQKTVPWYWPGLCPTLALPPGSHPPPRGQPAGRRVHPSLASQPSCSHWGLTSQGSSQRARCGPERLRQGALRPLGRDRE